MSNEAIPARLEAQTSDASWFNLLRSVMTGSIFPRNTGAVVQTAIGGIGSSTYRWLRAYIAAGYWSAGDVKIHHSFNGAKGPGQGWMLCDGRTVSEANYDAEHGAGSWATYVGTSPLDGKYLPDMNNRYPVGVAATPQTGAGAIVPSGNTGHSVSIGSHLHQYIDQNSGAPANTWDAAGASTPLSGITSTGPQGVLISQAQRQGANLYTDQNPAASKTIQPESIQSQFYMRVV